MPKVHHKSIKRPRMGSNKESKGQPKCAVVWRTGQCPVHQGTRRPTLHLREFSEGSAIIHRTVRCTTGQCPVHQGTPSQTLHLREFSEGSAIIHRTVRCTIGQCLVPQGRATLNSPASGIRSAIIHRTCPVHTGLSGELAEQRLLRTNGRLQTH